MTRPALIDGSVRPWAEAALGRSIGAIEPFNGGLTNSTFSVQVDDDDPVILRYLLDAPVFTTPERQARSEALACSLLHAHPLLHNKKWPVPRLLAVDPTGDQAGAPATLTSWLPGVIQLDRLPDSSLQQLASFAAGLHAVSVPPDSIPDPFDSWIPEDLRVPDWAGDASLWKQAIDQIQQPPPDTLPTLLHRDFHPGNALWRDVAQPGRRELSGVIDWADASWGAADLDVAHCVSNFAMLHDFAAANTFVTYYRDAGGVLDHDREARAYWQVLDILSFLPDPAYIMRAILVALPDTTEAVVRTRLEELLRRSLQTPASVT